MCIWDKSKADWKGIFWYASISFILLLFNIYDLNKETAAIDTFIHVCGVYLFQAEKADGFVNLPDFTVERASECKKKQ